MKLFGHHHTDCINGASLSSEKILPEFPQVEQEQSDER